MMAGGCVLFAVFIGMVDGSYGNLIDMFTRDRTGHIQIHRSGYLNKPSIYRIITDHEITGEKISRFPDVMAWAPRIYTPALAFAGMKTNGVSVTGIDPHREAKATRIMEKISTGRFLSQHPRHEIIITDRISRLLNISLGDKIALITGSYDDVSASVLQTSITSKYQISRNAGLLLGLTYFSADVEIDEQDELTEIAYAYNGLFLGVHFGL